MQNKLYDVADNGKLGYEQVVAKYNSPGPCCRFYTLILMDINMPVMDGLQSVKLINEFLNSINEKTKTKICMHYAYIDKTTEEYSQELGINLFL